MASVPATATWIAWRLVSDSAAERVPAAARRDVAGHGGGARQQAEGERDRGGELLGVLARPEGRPAATAVNSSVAVAKCWA